MKVTIFATLLVLGLVVSHVTAASLDQYFDDQGDLQLDLDEETLGALGDVLASSWFSRAAHKVSHAVSHAARDVGHAVKKGCGVVNGLPGDELMRLRDAALRNEEIDEEQAAAAYQGYKNLKSACRLVG
nr:uncharacterized protein LOC129271468 [Lytechinus pictus]